MFSSPPLPFLTLLLPFYATAPSDLKSVLLPRREKVRMGQQSDGIWLIVDMK